MYFKPHLHILIFVLFCGSGFASVGGNEVTFENANLAYENGRFDIAVENYELLIKRGLGSENTKFNLANAYFKTGQIGKSILYYEKVLKQNPQNKDALKNLAFVKTKLEQHLNELPDLFFVVWWKNLVYFFKADTWAWIAVSLAWFAVFALAVYYFSTNRFLKKTASATLFIFVFLAIFSVLLMKINNGSMASKTEVVLTQKQSQAKDAPSENAQNLNLFYEGSKLEVLDSLEGFYKTKNADQETVWVLKADFEKI